MRPPRHTATPGQGAQYGQGSYARAQPWRVPHEFARGHAGQTLGLYRACRKAPAAGGRRCVLAVPCRRHAHGAAPRAPGRL